MRIIAASVGSPGSQGDSVVFRSTQLFAELRAPPAADGYRGFLPPQCFLVGDQAYPLYEFLMVPASEDEQGYNAALAHCSRRLRNARRVVERVFGCVSVLGNSLFYAMHRFHSEQRPQDALEDTHRP